MAAQFDGKVALVTGGNAGIGKATALQFAREGARVVIAARRADAGEQTVSEIRDAGGEAIFVRTDVSRTDDVKNMVDTAVSTYGRLDYAFNNAGIVLDRGRTHEHTLEDWDQTIGINLKGLWLCVKYEVMVMLDQGGGAIVNDASTSGLVGGMDRMAYRVSKAGVIMISRTAAVEYAKTGHPRQLRLPGHHPHGHPRPDDRRGPGPAGACGRAGGNGPRRAAGGGSRVRRLAVLRRRLLRQRARHAHRRRLHSHPPRPSRDTLNNPSARLNFLCVELQSTDLFRPSLAAGRLVRRCARPSIRAAETAALLGVNGLTVVRSIDTRSFGRHDAPSPIGPFALSDPTPRRGVSKGHTRRHRNPEAAPNPTPFALSDPTPRRGVSKGHTRRHRNPEAAPNSTPFALSAPTPRRGVSKGPAA